MTESNFVDDEYDMVVIGGGPAGLAGAIKSSKLGLKVLVLENKDWLGGIPIQCVHPGFGNFYYDEDFTGPEFSNKLVEKIEELDVEYLTNTHVEKIVPVSDLKKNVKFITPGGVAEISTTTLLYATGARERHIHEAGIRGDRVSGIYTAGEAQTLMDLHGVMPGKEIVIIGSGDIGLIMARRFFLEGADVKGVMEMLPYPGGLTRNVAQCLRDFEIPLNTRWMVRRIIGNQRVEKIVASKVDEKYQPVSGTEKEIECDTVILALGLIPYTKRLEDLDVRVDHATRGPIVNEYLETSAPGVFAAGNVLAINDYVDYAADQGELAAEGAKIFVENENSGIPIENWIRVKKGRNIKFVIPHYISGKKDVTFYARVKKPEVGVNVKFPEINMKIWEPSVNPGDMLKVDICRRDLEKVDKELTMEVVS